VSVYLDHRLSGTYPKYTVLLFRSAETTSQPAAQRRPSHRRDRLCRLGAAIRDGHCSGERSRSGPAEALLQQRIASDTAFAARFYRALAIFLADRLRATTRRLGYGGTRGLDDETVLKDELDMGVHDTVSQARDRVLPGCCSIWSRGVSHSRMGAARRASDESLHDRRSRHLVVAGC